MMYYLQRSYPREYKRNRTNAFITISIEVSTTNGYGCSSCQRSPAPRTSGTSCPTGQCSPAHSSRTTSAKTNSRHQRAWGNVSTVFSYFASAAAAFRVHVSACSNLSLPCVYLRSVRSPLHLASWLTLFIALLSAFRADMYFILVFPVWEVLWFVCLLPHDRCYLF